MNFFPALSAIASATSLTRGLRGLICTWRSTVLPQTGVHPGWPAGGIAFQERIARTLGSTGLRQYARLGSCGKVTTYVSGLVGLEAQSVEFAMSCALNDARPASCQPAP